MELLLNGFEDDVQDDTGSADEGGRFANAAIETGCGIAQGGFHLLEGRSMPLGQPGKVGEVAVAFNEEIDKAAVGSSVEDFVVRDKGIGDFLDDAINNEGETGE